MVPVNNRRRAALCCPPSEASAAAESWALEGAAADEEFAKLAKAIGHPRLGILRLLSRKEFS